ncbi:IRF tryptophan pentad repeat domain-containing protein [Caerostris extrusa]|uniref:IRF tryptophan pentad repeat domain-containing protein n=1 Tax=Caerostris extrusa TaxID=172846 RepID=A0AAV4VXL5_CAEEX|nr:IRF tryptophan pentad repeat domain-containing protein [Caerostris extrusa]
MRQFLRTSDNPFPFTEFSSWKAGVREIPFLHLANKHAKFSQYETCAILEGSEEYLENIKEKFIKMGRNGSKLITFFLDGLKTNKYQNLKFEDSSRLIFSLYLPFKTNKLDKKNEDVLKDWYHINNKKYFYSTNYTEAKQAMMASLRKSDYVEQIAIGDNKMTFRILTPKEIKGKGKNVNHFFFFQKKERKLILKKEKQNKSVALPGYGSNMNNPYHALSPYNATGSINENNGLLQAIEHDHYFGFSPFERLPSNGNVSEASSYENAEVQDGHTKFVARESGNIETNANLLEEVCNQEHNIVSLDDLDKIPSNDLVKCGETFDMEEFMSIYIPDGDIHDFSKKPENRFLCKKLEYLVKTPILICEYLDSQVSEVDFTSGQFKIICDEAVLKEILDKNLKISDYQLVNGHMLVILEPDIP